jgi:hypothetical protein
MFMMCQPVEMGMRTNFGVTTFHSTVVKWASTGTRVRLFFFHL